MAAPVNLACPNCGAPCASLDVTGHPDTPPYLCVICSRGWWAVELGAAARQAWDPSTRSHLDPTVRAAAHAEHDAIPGSVHHGRANS